MDIHIHLGTHFSGTADLIGSFDACATQLSAAGRYAPPERNLRRTVRGALQSLDGMPPIAEEQEKLLKALLPSGDTGGVTQLLLAEESWVGRTPDAFGADMLYGEIAENAGHVVELFAHNSPKISLSLRNPAVFLHHVYHASNMKQYVGPFLERVAPEEISWLPTIEALRKAAPDAPLTLWCYEDSPLIWPRLMRHLTGLDLCTAAADDKAFGPLTEALEPEGFARFRTYLEKHPPQSDLQFEKIVLAFLDKYAHEAFFDETVDLPGWGSAEIEEVTAGYAEDIDALAEQDGITVLLPESFEA